MWNIPEWPSADARYLDLVGTVLGGSPSSRLYRRLVQQEQVATDVSATVSLAQLGSQLSIVVTAKTEADLEKIQRLLDEELADFLDRGPTLGEVEAARSRWRARFLRGVERIGAEFIGGISGKSTLLAENQVLGGSPDFYKVTLQRVERATRRDLQGAAGRWLSDGDFTLELRPLPAQAAQQLSIDRQKIPAAGSIPPAKLPPVKQTTLSNGLRVFLAERPFVPLLELQLIVDAGSAANGDVLRGLTALASQMLGEGTTRRSGAQIAETLDSLGAQLSATTQSDASVLTLSGLSDHLDGMLDVLADIVQHPTFPANALEARKAQLLARAEREKATPTSLAQRLLLRLLQTGLEGGGAPTRASTIQRPLSAVGIEDLAAFHRRWYTPNNVALVVVGATTMEALRPKLERAFGDWQPGPGLSAPSGPVQPVERSSPVVYLVDTPGATQTVVAVGVMVPPRTDSAYLAIRASAVVLGGGSGSRLLMNLRESKQWAYTAYSVLTDTRGSLALMALAPVQADRTGEAMQEVLNELRDIAGARPISDEELRQAKRSQLRFIAARAQTNALVADAVSEIARFGLESTYFETLGRRIDALSAAEVSAAAARVIHPDHLTWLVVGDRRRIESAVRSLGFGEIQVIDADGHPVP